MTHAEALTILTEQIEDFLPEEKWKDYEDALSFLLKEVEAYQSVFKTMIGQVRDLNKALSKGKK